MRLHVLRSPALASIPRRGAQIKKPRRERGFRRAALGPSHVLVLDGLLGIAFGVAVTRLHFARGFFGFAFDLQLGATRDFARCIFRRACNLLGTAFYLVLVHDVPFNVRTVDIGRGNVYHRDTDTVHYSHKTDLG